jgi:hypothetical protein
MMTQTGTDACILEMAPFAQPADRDTRERVQAFVRSARAQRLEYDYINNAWTLRARVVIRRGEVDRG